MKIYFNSIGIITNVSNIGDSLRQGSVGNVLEAHFEGVDNAYHSAKFNFTRSDGSKVNNVVMEWDNNNAEVFRFVFNDSWFFALAGTTTLTIYLYDTNGNVTTQGQHQFSIESTDYDEEPTITLNQYNEIMTAIAGKVATGNIIDNLESDASDKPLSARMGKALKQDVDTSVASAKSEIYAKVEEETTRIETELDTKFETERAELRAQVDEIKEENEYLRGEVNDLRNGLYGSVLGLEDEAYEDVGVAVIDRANDYQIINNQRAQVKGIKGKSLVVNQLVNLVATKTAKGLTFTNNGDGSITISGTTTETGFVSFTKGVKTIVGNKYICLDFPATTSDYAFNNASYLDIPSTGNGIVSATREENASIYINIKTVGIEINLTFKPRITNLNKAFVSQTLPTTIEEFRKATIGFDFETYNEGTLTSTEISKFMVNPFNAFDGTMYQVGINNNTGNQFNSNINITSGYIPVISGETYTWSESTQEGWKNRYVYCYDKDQKYIRSIRFGFNTVDYHSAKLPDNCCFVRISYYDDTETQLLVDQIKNICFHLTGNGAFNGTYRPHIAPTEYPIPTVKLDGVGTAQDEIGVDENVTRTGSVDLGTRSFSRVQVTLGGNSCYVFRLLGGIPNMPYKTDEINYINSAGYTPITNQNASQVPLQDKVICFTAYWKAEGDLIIRDDSYTDEASFKSGMKDEKLCYKIKTPITLKKKYTAKVDLGTPNWQYAGGNIFYAELPSALACDDYKQANIYCEGYATVERADLADGTISLSQKTIVVKNTKFTNASTFKQASVGKPFYYETAQEVTETVDELFLPEIILEGVERGGTVATDSNGDITITHVVYKPIQ